MVLVATLTLVLVLVASAVVLSAIVLSGRISRDEERRPEIPPLQDRPATSSVVTEPTKSPDYDHVGVGP